MIRFLIKRIFLALIQIFIVLSLVFLLLHIMPGDPAVLALGTDRTVDPQVVEALRHELGLDKPILEQYLIYIKNVANLNFGNSITDKVPVMSYIAERIPRTIELAFLSIIVASIIGVVLGMVAALERKKAADIITTSLAALGISLPVFVLGTLFIYVFSFSLRLLPAGGFIALSKNAGAHYARLVLPVATLALPMAASIARMTRSSMLEVLNKEVVQTLYAKGLSRQKVVFGHVLRNAMIPIVTIIGLQFGNLIGGTVLIEYLFNLPGLCSVLLKAISYRDYPLIQGCIFVMSSFYILVNMFVDILYGALDPRVR